MFDSINHFRSLWTYAWLHWHVTTGSQRSSFSSGVAAARMWWMLPRDSERMDSPVLGSLVTDASLASYDAWPFFPWLIPPRCIQEGRIGRRDSFQEIKSSPSVSALFSSFPFPTSISQTREKENNSDRSLGLCAWGTRAGLKKRSGKTE